MVEKDEQAAVAEAAAPEAQEVPKPRLKKPVKPDVEEHKAAVEKLQQEFNRRRDRMDQLKQLIDHKRNAGDSPEVAEARKRLNQLTANFKAELEKKKGVREELQTVNKQRDALRAKVRELRGQVGSYSSVQKIDERVAGLEYHITHHTLALREENRMREEMKKLTQLKPAVAAYGQEQETLKASDSVRERLLAALKTCDEQVTAIKAEEEKQRAHVNELRGKEASKQVDISALYKEREECWEVRNALKEKIQELRTEHQARHDKYWEEHQAWLKQQQEDRQQRQLLREKENAERDAARKAAAAEYAGEPYHKEVGLCEQLISHLSKYQQAAAAPTVATPAAAVDTSAAFEGMKAIKKRNDEPEDGFGVFYGSAAKKGKGAKKSAKAKAGPSAVAPADQKLNHSLDMLDAFSTLKVSVPTTASRVAEAVKEVEERKTYYLKKRAEAKEKGILAGEEPEASSSRAQANGVAPKKQPKANGVLDFAAEEWPDFAGNVRKSASATAPAAGEHVSVKLGVEGDRVSLTCTPSS